MLEAAVPIPQNVVVVPLAVEALKSAGAAHRLCRGGRNLRAASPESARCRGAAVPTRTAAFAIAPYDGHMSRRSGGLSRENRPRRSDHRRPSRVSPSGRRIFSLARRRGPWRQRESGGAAVARGRSARRARPVSRARQSDGSIPAPIISASPWCRTTRSPPRRCIASWWSWMAHDPEKSIPIRPDHAPAKVASDVDDRTAALTAWPLVRPSRRRIATAAARARRHSLISLAMMAGLSLASWSVQDPSLSHATDAPVHDLLGVPVQLPPI